MTNSAFDVKQLSQSNVATLYLDKEFPLAKYSSPSYPDGFINTSNKDLALYLMEMIKGHGGNGTLLSDESYQLLFERKTPTDIEDAEIHSIFWDLVDGRIEHNGSDPGLIAWISFDPIKGTGYQLIMNINEEGLGEALGIDTDKSYEDILHVLEMVKEFEVK